MDYTDQREFIHELISAVTREINAIHDKGRIPANWDGIELRQWVADRFASYTCKMSRSRKMSYTNTIMITPDL